MVCAATRHRFGSVIDVRCRAVAWTVHLYELSTDSPVDGSGAAHYTDGHSTNTISPADEQYTLAPSTVTVRVAAIRRVAAIELSAIVQSLGTQRV